MQDFFFDLFARETKVIVGPLQQIDNSLLDLQINTNPNSAPSNNNNLTQKSGIIGYSDWQLSAPILNLNGDGFFRQENANSVFRKNENFCGAKISGVSCLQAKGAEKQRNVLKKNLVLKNLRFKTT